jgi:small subunit ribosomal protein S8
MQTDPISDMIVRLKNAGLAKREVVAFPASALKMAIAEKLKQIGYLKTVEKRGKKVQKTIEAELVYTGGKAKISDVKRISKPSARVYHRHHQIRAVRQGTGFAFYSTPQGIMTDKEAREAKVGGEILFKIW